MRMLAEKHRCGFSRIVRDGCSILDLPELAFESGLIPTESLARLKRGSEALRAAPGEFTSRVEDPPGHSHHCLSVGDSPFGLFDKIVAKIGGRSLRSVLVECHSRFDPDLKRCQLVGPLAAEGLIAALAQRFGVEFRPDDRLFVPAPSPAMREVYRNFMCFVRPREGSAAPLRVVTCDLDVLDRRSELETTLQASVSLELTSLDRVVAAWRAGPRSELHEDVNALFAAVEQLNVLQPSTMVNDHLGRPTRRPAPAVGYFGRSAKTDEPFTSVSWALAVASLKERANGSADVSIDAAESGESDPATEQLDPLDRLVLRMLGETDACAAEWLEVVAGPDAAVVRYGGPGWSVVRDQIPRKIVPSLHAALARVFEVSPEVGGQGRHSMELDANHRLTTVAWIAPKRLMLRPRQAEQPVAQIRIVPTSELACTRGDLLASSIIRCAREYRDARILLVASEVEGADAELCSELRRHRPFVDFAYVGLGEASQARGLARALETDVGDQRLDELRSCEPIVPTLVALGEARRPAEADEVVRLALGGSYVVVRVAGTGVELATMNFLSSVTDRSIASALLLASIRISRPRDCRLRWPAGFDGCGPIKREIMRHYGLLLFTSTVRELVAKSVTYGELRRTGGAIEFGDEYCL